MASRLPTKSRSSPTPTNTIKPASGRPTTIDADWSASSPPARSNTAATEASAKPQKIFAAAESSLSNR